MNRFAIQKPYKDPRVIAEETLIKSGTPRLPNGYGIDVEKIVREFCGFELMHIAGLELGGKPVLGIYAHTINALLVEDDCPEARKRFTIAHELGHAQLEYDFGNAVPMFDLPEMFGCIEEDEKLGPADELKDGLRRKKEIRANQFAAHLLMPEGLVREIWSLEHQNVDRTASALCVSREALGYRLRGLNLS
jgi:Zn-dependent peptidase ImmA (M78 family)